MITVSSDDLWDKLEDLSSKSKTKKAAIAYVTDDSFIKFTKGDILVADVSENAIAAGRTSAKIISEAFKNGAEIYSCDTLHAKTIVFDHHAYIGSANISFNSRNTLNEIGIITELPNVLSEAIQFIEQIKLQSQKIDQRYINKILDIDVIQCSDKSRGKKRKVKIESSISWMISVFNNAKYPGNEALVEKDNEKIEVSKNEESHWFWVKATLKNFYDKVKVGDSVVIIEREYDSSDTPDHVYRHIVIQKITDDKENNIKAYHYAYNDKHRCTWKKFVKLAEQLDIKRLGTGLNTSRELKKTQSDLLFAMLTSPKSKPSEKTHF